MIPNWWSCQHFWRFGNRPWITDPNQTCRPYRFCQHYCPLEYHIILATFTISTKTGTWLTLMISNWWSCQCWYFWGFGNRITDPNQTCRLYRFCQHYCPLTNQAMYQNYLYYLYSQAISRIISTTSISWWLGSPWWVALEHCFHTKIEHPHLDGKLDRTNQHIYSSPSTEKYK